MRVKYLIHQKAILNFNTKYCVDAYGNVKNLWTGRTLKQNQKDKNKPFSLAVSIFNNVTGKKQQIMVHRLVYYYFGKHLYKSLEDIKYVVPINKELKNWQQISNLTDLNTKQYQHLKNLKI